MSLKNLRESIMGESNNVSTSSLESGDIISIETKGGLKLKLAKLNKTEMNRTREIFALVTLDKKKYVSSVYSGGSGVGGINLHYLQDIGETDIGHSAEFIEFV